MYTKKMRSTTHIHTHETIEKKKLYITFNITSSFIT